jgi:DNA polymerase/3'-5' exonuclease PolX
MLPYNKAKQIADRIVEVLQPLCTKIDIAGSVRREKEEVKDIEIVCLPKKIFYPTDLFGGGYYNVDTAFTTAIKAISLHIIKGNEEGRYMQVKLKGGFVMDLFMPQAHDYCRQLAIRTGNFEYSRFVIANAWLRKGWCGTNQGLRLITDCTETPAGWKVLKSNPELPPVWQSEKEFFTWLGIDYLEPKHRYLKQTINQFQ